MCAPPLLVSQDSNMFFIHSDNAPVRGYAQLKVKIDGRGQAVGSLRVVLSQSSNASPCGLDAGLVCLVGGGVRRRMAVIV